MNEETINQIKRYKLQLIFLFVTIVSLIISILVIKLLLDVSYKKVRYQRVKDQITSKSRIASLLILLSVFYFVYDAYLTYKNNRTNANFNFLIAASLVLIAALIRTINLFKDTNQVLEAEDIV
ncbi:MAG: hypothetical protein SOW55_03890 [Bacilli bacterium]|nr:hypothetical protein [Bacillales bacterium]MDY2575097.1 hypothetical protein [Bacilli bacterium]